MPRWPRLVDSGDPFSYLRIAVGVLLIVATLVAIGLAITGMAPRALLLVGLFWGIYGFFYAVVGGILEPFIDFGARVLSDVGLAGGRILRCRSMEAQGNYALAADTYGQRARDLGMAEAAMRQARLLAGPLQDPGRAMVELRRFLELHPRAGGRARVRAQLTALKHQQEPAT